MNDVTATCIVTIVFSEQLAWLLYRLSSNIQTQHFGLLGWIAEIFWMEHTYKMKVGWVATLSCDDWRLDKKCLVFPSCLQLNEIYALETSHHSCQYQPIIIMSGILTKYWRQTQARNAWLDLIGILLEPSCFFYNFLDFYQQSIAWPRGIIVCWRVEE